LQIQDAGSKAGPFTVLKNVVKNEGFGTLYTGLGAAWLRQATYTTARLGMFNQFMDIIKAGKKAGEGVSFAERGIAGLVAGGLGALVGTPADLALVRLQADGTLPVEQRRNYTGVGNALSRIVKEEGVSGLWKGAAPTVVRAMALNFGMLAFNGKFIYAV
jgi:solute carrier family 25 oxoglutarate transporter 11